MGLHRGAAARGIGFIMLGLPLAACDPATLPGGPYMRPVALVDYSISAAYADPVTGAVPAVQPVSGLSTTHVPVLDLGEVIDIDTPAKRDFIQDALLQRSDVLCQSYMDGLYYRVAARRAVLSQIAQVASAIGAFSTAAQGPSIAALVANIAGGTNNVLDSEVMQSQLITLITKQIETNRAQVLGMIMTARQDANRVPVPLSKYALSLALRDAMTYHQQCSFVQAITGLAAVAGRPNPTTTTQSGAAASAAANAEADALTSAAGITRRP